MLKNNQKKELVLIEDLGYLYAKETSKKKSRYGLYKCFCGNEFKCVVESVKSKRTKSCGCYNKESHTTHGMRSHRLYYVWQKMIVRCNNEKNKDYIHYGARNIKVCERWFDINNFIDDMYPTFKDGLTIDIIDVNGNYEPSNCRWADKYIQSQNTRIIHSTNKSGYRGVNFHIRVKKWVAQIGVNKKKIHIGYFNNPIDAAKAYDRFVIDNNLEHNINVVL